MSAITALAPSEVCVRGEAPPRPAGYGAWLQLDAKVFKKPFPFKATEAELAKQLQAAYDGTVASVRMPRNRKGERQGLAFVR